MQLSIFILNVMTKELKKSFRKGKEKGLTNEVQCGKSKFRHINLLFIVKCWQNSTEVYCCQIKF